MKLKDSPFIITMIYFIGMTVSMFIPNIYNYSWVFCGIIALSQFLCIGIRKAIDGVIQASALTIPIFLLANTGIVNFVVNWTTFFLVSSFLNLTKSSNIALSQLKILTVWTFLFITVFFLMTLDPSRYGDTGRFSGWLPSSTVSSSVMGLMLVFLMEHFFMTRYRKIVFFLCCVILIITILLCNTRSLFFVVPYFLYYFYKVILKRKFRILAGVLTICLTATVIWMVFDNAEKLRIEDKESSYLTRFALYEMEISGIVDYYGIKPHGLGACNEYIKELVSEEFSPHNDFLAFWYDMGIIGLLLFALLFVWMVKFAKNYRCGLRLSLIMLFVSSCALHNILFSVFIWPIIFLILYELKARYYKNA